MIHLFSKFIPVTCFFKLFNVTLLDMLMIKWITKALLHIAIETVSKHEKEKQTVYQYKNSFVTKLKENYSEKKLILVLMP